MLIAVVFLFVPKKSYLFFFQQYLHFLKSAKTDFDSANATTIINSTLQNLNQNIVPDTNNTYDLGTTGNKYANVYATLFQGTATSARFADLAENYQADDTYEPGTVLVFGGSAEVTATNKTHDTRVAGVVSTNPAYLMNKDSGNTSLGLTGRLPCLVKGPVDKGTLLVTSTTPGVAQALNDAYYKPGCVIGKSMNTLTDSSIELIEIAVGRF